jgi:hypothetical protein
MGKKAVNTTGVISIYLSEASDEILDQVRRQVEDEGLDFDAWAEENDFIGEFDFTIKG